MMVIPLVTQNLSLIAKEGQDTASIDRLQKGLALSQNQTSTAVCKYTYALTCIPFYLEKKISQETC